jgi:acyl-CoA thioesterase-1
MRLPYLVPAIFALSLPLLPASASAMQTILVFGDSLSAGYGIPREAGWVHLLQTELGRSHPQYRLVNASISGETTAGGLQRIEAALRQHQPAILVLELGANDGLRGSPVSHLRRNLAAMLDHARRAKCRVLLLGMRLPPNYGTAYTTEFHAVYTQLAQRYQTRLVPFMLADIPPGGFLADNLHPAASAQPRILRQVLTELKPLLTAPD